MQYSPAALRNGYALSSVKRAPVRGPFPWPCLHVYTSFSSQNITATAEEALELRSSNGIPSAGRQALKALLTAPAVVLRIGACARPGMRGAALLLASLDTVPALRRVYLEHQPALCACQARLLGARCAEATRLDCCRNPT